MQDKPTSEKTIDELISGKYLDPFLCNENDDPLTDIITSKDPYQNISVIRELNSEKLLEFKASENLETVGEFLKIATTLNNDSIIELSNNINTLNKELKKTTLCDKKTGKLLEVKFFEEEDLSYHDINLNMIKIKKETERRIDLSKNIIRSTILTGLTYGFIGGPAALVVGGSLLLMKGKNYYNLSELNKKTTSLQIQEIKINRALKKLHHTKEVYQEMLNKILEENYDPYDI